MSEIKFASEQAQKLAEENGLDLTASNGSGKGGTFTVSDIRTLLAAKDFSDSAGVASDVETNPKPQKQFKVEKNPSGHVEQYFLVDTTKEENDPNRVARVFSRKDEAKSEADRLNKLSK